MLKYLDKTAKTQDEAIALALSELGLERDDVTVEVLERPKSGFLGIGSSPAVVRIGYHCDETISPVSDEALPDVTEAKPDFEAAAQEASKPLKQKSKKAETAEKGAEIAAEITYDDPTKAAANEFLRGLLSRMNINANIDIKDAPKGGLLITLSGKGMGAVIGRRGETLDAIQHLTNFALNRGGDKRQRISIDAENYRAKREQSLVSLAEKMAAKVVKYKRSMALEPMNSYERHVIHTALQAHEGISTASTGAEPNRRVVVSYTATSAKEPEKTPTAREWS
ncbi:MAG: protein jag [Ruminococcaceae bacterium]|nr:protein jag [Oscillospiraceae bacterium]